MKNAIVTGATKGIGRAIAVALAKEGINLAICSRNSDELAATRNHLLTLCAGLKIVYLQTDVSDKDQLQKFAAFALQSLGSVQIIVNNAAAYVPCSILDDTEGSFTNMLHANLRPGYELYRYFGKNAREVGLRHIFNISSVAAKIPVAEAGMYTVTKAAALSLSNIMRMEMKDAGVKVTAIIPGSTLTSSWDGVQTDKDNFVLPEDIASAVITIYKMSAGANVDELVITPLKGQQ